MKRTVFGIVLAAALLTPVSGLAAPRHNTTPIPISWWEVVMNWAERLLGKESGPSAKSSTVPASPANGDGSEPILIQNSTTIDSNGAS
jgi:hypothetical protein